MRLEETYQAEVAESIKEYPTNAEEKSQENAGGEIHNDFRRQSKKVSQLIAKSWLSNDPEGAELKAAFLRGNSDEIEGLLKKYGIDFERFFGPLSIEVQWNSFEGVLKEQIPNGVKYLLPYPPRPSEVTDEQLDSWVNNQDPNTIYPPYPYIPLSAL